MQKNLRLTIKWLTSSGLWLCLLFMSVAQASVVSTGWLSDPNHPPVETRFVLTGQTDAVNGTVAGYLEVRLQKGWKTYWRSPGEGGVAPSINWQDSANIAGLDWQWPVPQRYDVLGVETIGYAEDVIFPMTIRVEDFSQPVILLATLSLSSCSTVCVITDYPIDLSFIPSELTPSETDMRRYAQALSTVPQASSLAEIKSAIWDAEQSKLQLVLSNEQGWVKPDLFIDGDAEAIKDSHFSRPDISIEGSTLTAQIGVSSWFGQPDLEQQLLTVTVTDDAVLSEHSLQVQSGIVAAQAGHSLLVMFGLALLGGLILNIMPCVLPVLGMKLSTVLTAEKQEKQQIRLQFLASAGGIISAFWLIALALVALKLSGQAIGWGIQFQSGAFLAVMVLVTFMFGANMLGLFTISLPSGISTWLGTQGGKGYAGHYAQGMFATFLATPCSAPFLGTAVAFALAGSVGNLAVIFTGLGLGMALPWMAIALFPFMVRWLPKPGVWMGKMKVLFGIMMLATTLWLLTLLAPHWPIWSLWLAGIAGMSLIIWRSVKVFGAKPVGVLGSMFLLLSAVVLLTASLTAEKWATPLPPEPSWQPLFAADIGKQVAQGKTVFVDVTADWCITCKANKVRVLLQQPVYDAIQQPGLVRMQGDWTIPNDAVTAYLQANGRFGVPFNIVYGPGAPQGIALPVIYTSEDVMLAIQQAQGG
ncbi:protein-disulfide reductase DsbD family protein [Photobacterium halotolerans]|uniref:Cytochrome C biogenesis protein n=1 Tax=Photobacterium halotolerans TaxID=265726 RepID=A0A7X4WFW7_9GAMM|nr:protein-disulfide reductase DsbD domain-containing protein [Photobacterium halotolerans]NAW67155.1 cytochrome C biogenesis protein [Photobacterium halotolerans]